MVVKERDIYRVATETGPMGSREERENHTDTMKKP